MTDPTVWMWEYRSPVELMAAAPDAHTLEWFERPASAAEAAVLADGPITATPMAKQAMTLDGWMPIAWTVLARGLDQEATRVAHEQAEAELRGRIVSHP
jgi:hypothetical protein